MVLIPFSFLPPRVVLKLSNGFMSFGSWLSHLFPYLQLELDRADVKVEAKRYLAMCIVSSLLSFLLTGTLLVVLLEKIGQALFGPLIALALCTVILLMQVNYPKVLAARRIRKLEQDLLAALRTLLIHQNSGVPLFEALVIISQQQFGEVSLEFKKAVQKINAGVPAIEALETMVLQNPSPYFRRTIWQIINGLKSGSSISQVMENVIDNLSKEEVIQIEKYGAQLNPLAMFYLIVAIIVPALGITFLVVLASFINISELLLKIIFWSLFTLVIFFQIMFIGIIKTRRPTLLSE